MEKEVNAQLHRRAMKVGRINTNRAGTTYEYQRLQRAFSELAAVLPAFPVFMADG